MNFLQEAEDSVQTAFDIWVDDDDGEENKQLNSAKACALVDIAKSLRTLITLLVAKEEREKNG